MQDATRAKAVRMVDEALYKIRRLRGTGPNPFDYWLWADETVQTLETIFGRGAAEAQTFAGIVYERGRTPDQRGNFDAMTLGIHGEWGIRARLDRAEALLEQVHARLSAPASTPSSPTAGR
jgi:hypothetical protein